MANRKITELEELTTLDNQDVLPIVDSSEIKTKKVTVTKLLEQPHTHTASQITDLDTTVNNLISGSNGSGHGTGSVTAHNDITSAGSGSIITGTERNKLNGITAGATANQTDTHLLSRANHTGTQAVNTISGLGSIAVKNLPTTTDNNTQQTINGAVATALPILP